MKAAGRKKLERETRKATGASRRAKAGPKTAASPKAAAVPLPKGAVSLPTATGRPAKSTGALPSSAGAVPKGAASMPKAIPAAANPRANSAASRRGVSDDARRGVLVAPTGVKSKRRAALAAEVQSNPFRFLIKDEMELLFDLGGDVLTTLRGMGAPVVGKKMNPRLLLKWLESNHDRVPKVRAEEGAE